MNLTKFVSLKSLEDSKLGSFCRMLDEDPMFKKTHYEYDKKLVVSSFRKRYGKQLIDDFFNEYLEAQYAK